MQLTGMRALIAGLSIAVFGLGVAANEKPTADFQSLMKSNGAANGAVRKAAAGKDHEGVAAAAATLKENYPKIEAFFAAKKMDDAVAFAKTGAKAAADLETAAKAKNDEGIATASKAVGGTCMGCHAAHRAELPDKTYEIK